MSDSLKILSISHDQSAKNIFSITEEVNNAEAARQTTSKILYRNIVTASN